MGGVGDKAAPLTLGLLRAEGDKTDFNDIEKIFAGRRIQTEALGK